MDKDTDKDEFVLTAISDLADEEHRLLAKESRDGATDDDRERLRDIDVELDRCWDLLRQRRARRSAGQDPESAAVRSARAVEGYQQ